MYATENEPLPPDDCQCETLKASRACLKKLRAESARLKKLRAKQAQLNQLEVEDANFSGTATFEGDVNLTGSATFEGDVNLSGTATFEGDVNFSGTTTFQGPVVNQIGGTYTIRADGTGDFPTIQAALDLVNSGLKPDSNVIFEIAPGRYTESLLVDTDIMSPGLNGPNTDIPNIRTRCLKLIGDKRLITCMTYMKGGLLRRPGQSNLLGGLNGVVDLTTSGNTITVTSSIAPNPDFVASQVVVGDTVIVTDNNGNAQERTITAIGAPLATNQITVNAPVSISGNGAALTFCPNVKVTGSIPDVILHVAGGAVQVQGIWFSGMSTAVPTFAYGLLIQNTGALYIDRILVDMINVSGSIDIVGIDSGAYIDATAADFTQAGLATLIHGAFADFINGSVGGIGEWYALSRSGQAISISCGNGKWFSGSLQINGASRTTSGILINGNNPSVRVGVYSAFNCNNGMSINSGGNTGLVTSLIRIDNSNTGINIADGSNVIFSGAGVFATLTPSITNCTNGITLNAASLFETTRPLQITNCTNGIVANLDSRFDTNADLILDTITTGITLTGGSAFNSRANINFINVVSPYAIEESASYLTPNNAGTNPSPSDIFTYTTAGPGQAMNSAYLKQLLDSPGSVGLELNPALLVGTTPAHRGKIYTLGAITAGPHTLTLTGGATFVQGGTTRTFNGIGSTMTIEVISNTQVLILTSSGVS